MLRDAGYIAAVQVPEQRIADGVIRFRVLMAKLTQVRVRGDAAGAEKVIAGYLDQLTEQPVFNRFEAERYLLLASDIPGYSVRLTLRPAGTVPGEVVGDVTVQHIAAYSDLNIQNLGSEDLGRWGGLVRGQLFGLTGLGALTGGLTTNPANETAGRLVNNMLSVVFDPDAFCGAEEFRAEVTRMAHWVKASPPAVPGGDVLLPGEIERRTRAEREKKGIPVDAVTRQQIDEAVKPLGLELP